MAPTPETESARPRSAETVANIRNSVHEVCNRLSAVLLRAQRLESNAPDPHTQRQLTQLVEFVSQTANELNVLRNHVRSLTETDTPPPAPAHPEAILLVEDAGVVRKVLASYLAELGLSVDLAGGAGEGSDSYDPTKHKTVFIENDLHDGSGLHLAQALKARSPEVRIVLIADWGSERQPPPFIDHCLMKPLRFDQVRRFLQPQV